MAADEELKALRRLQRARAALARGLVQSITTIIDHLPSLRRHVTDDADDPVLVDMEEAAAKARPLMADLPSDTARRKVHLLANATQVLASGISELQHSRLTPEAHNLLAAMTVQLNRARRQFKAIRALLR